MPLLELASVTVRFGGKTAVDGLDLSVEQGQLVGLIGPNGAGKTTTIDAVTGFVGCEGAVTFDGTMLSGGEGRAAKRTVTPKQRSRMGLTRTWQGAELFADLTVLENLRVAGEGTPVDELRQILDDLGVEGFADGQVGALSHGQRKLVGVGRALAGHPKLVCMDEPAAGLDTLESQHLGERIRAITEEGTSVLLVDHDMGLVLSICDYLYVLDFGVLIAKGTPAQIRTDDRVIEAYLGRRHNRDLPAEPSA